jgi:2-keto-4-pentenoate hydratase/2-oxohepta-3-ene-1,7-dioic acid hydratase in catechol pathway
MKLVSFVAGAGPARTGALLDGDGDTRICDLAAASALYRAARNAGGFLLPEEMVAFLETGLPGLTLASEVVAWVAETGEATIPLASAKLVAPIPRPPKLLALAGNYQEHIAEGGGKRLDKSTAVPNVFIKPSTTVLGTAEPLVLPSRVSTTVDWELELGIVIGRRANDVSEDRALDYVAGYTILNDISSRTLEIVKRRVETTPRTLFFDWLNGKWQDGFAVMGPYLVTQDAIPDPQGLPLRLWVNDRLHQNGNTGQMIFGVAEIVAWISQLCTLEPGDVIATGTPSGVGSTTGTYLVPGDVLRGEIGGLGTQINPVVAGE